MKPTKKTKKVVSRARGKNFTSDDAIEKAFNEINELGNLEKAVDDEDEDEEVDETEEELEDEEVEETEEELEDEEEEDEDVEKAIEVSPVLKEFNKSINEINEKVDNNHLRSLKISTNLATLVKGTVDRLNSAIEMLESLPRATKSKIKKEQVIEKFDKGNDDELNGENVIGLKSHKGQIVKSLDAFTFTDDGLVDDVFSKAIIDLEAHGQIDPLAVKKLEEKMKCKIDVNN